MKADVLSLTEGSKPERVMASVQETTGVRGQGMFLKRLPGNLGDPYVSLWRKEGVRKSGHETKSRRSCGSPAALTSLLKGGATNIEEGQNRVLGKDS